MNTYKIEGQFNNEDEVIIKVEKSIPQPDIIETTTYTVAQIKNIIDSCDRTIADFQKTRDDMQALLDANIDTIKSSVVSVQSEVINKL